jgi:hypothetical protein
MKAMSRRRDTPADDSPAKLRKFHEPPAAISEQGWRFHHVGIPTVTPRSGEHYLEELKVFASGFDTSAYGVEWLRFESDSPIPPLIRSVPHVAFEVDNLEVAIAGREIVLSPFSPFPGVRAAMILENGTPIEVLEFS